MQQVGQYLGGLHFNVPPYGTDISQPTENVYFEIQKLVKVKGALQVKKKQKFYGIENIDTEGIIEPLNYLYDNLRINLYNSELF